MTALEIPRFGELLSPFISKVPDGTRPRFLALLERGAANRYRVWAEQLPAHAAVLLCRRLEVGRLAVGAPLRCKVAAVEATRRAHRVAGLVEVCRTVQRTAASGRGALQLTPCGARSAATKAK